MTKAYVIEEGTKNLVPNPKFSHDVPLVGWNRQAINATVEDGYVRLVATNESSASILASETAVGSLWAIKVTAGQTYTQSLEVKLPIGKSIELAAYYRSASNTYTGTPKTMVVQGTGDWERHSLLSTAPEGAIAVAFLVYLFGRPGATLVVGEECLIRHPQFEPKLYATSFACGDMGEGYSWEGDPHASASIREPSSISMPSPDPKSLYVRYSEDGENWVNSYNVFEDREDIEPALLLSPDDSRDRNGDATPTISGGVLVVDGEYGPAWQVAAATENLHQNPVVASATTHGWAVTQGTAGTVSGSKSNDQPDMSEWTYKTTVLTSQSTYRGTYFHTPMSGSTARSFTPSALVMSDVSQAVTLETRIVGGGVDNPQEVVQLTAGKIERIVWPTITTADGATPTNMQNFLFSSSSAPVGSSVWMTKAQIEEKPHATPYCDGSLGAGYAWTGGAHASSSTRSVGTVSLTTEQAAVVPWMKGSILLRTNLRNDAGSFMTLGYPWSSSNHIDVRSYDGTSYQVYLGTNSVLTYRPAGGIPVDTGFQTLYAEWDGEDIAISINGGPKMYSTRPTPVDLPWATWGLRLAGQRWHDPESVLAFDAPLSEAEIDRIANLPEAWTWENSTDLKVRLNLGDHSELTRYEGAIKLKTTKKLYIGTVIGFSRPLSTKEIEILDSTPLEYISGKTLLNLPETTVGVSQLL